jgi:FkbM family methyltransferase
MSWQDRVRLLYYADLKASLVFRGWTRYAPERPLAFSIKAPGNTRFQISACDNGWDAGTIALFFSPRSTIVPPGLPPLRPKVIYDLGANIGIASLFFASLYPEARVYGFEPLPSNYELCVRNYKNLPKAQAFPWAVGGRSEVTAFDCNEDPHGGHLLATPGNPKLRSGKSINVQVFSLADLVRVQKLEPPEFLKIDVEGAEVEVLRGMGEAVQSVRRIFVETHGASLKEECLKWMRQHDFQIRLSANPNALWGDRG